MALFFETSRRCTPDAEHVLFTNAAAVPSVDGVDLDAWLRRLGVEVVRLPYTYQPPEGYFGAWRNQFYVFDTIDHLAGRLADDDVGLVLDSDCVWLRSAAAMAEATRRYGALTYDVGLREDEMQNGLTRRTMGALYTDLGAPVEGVPPYVGGELVAVTGRIARELSAHLRPLTDEMRRRHAAGQPKFNEEAHALSYLYHKLGIPAGTANPYIKRIWTTLAYGENAAASDLDLTVWHVPAEKRYGLRRLFAAEVRAPGTVAAAAPELGRWLGVPTRTPRKWVLDVATALRDQVRLRLERRFS